MSATYRYLLADVLTNSILLEIPFAGATFSRKLNGPGNATFSFQLDSIGSTVAEQTNYNQMVLDSTIPGRTAVYIERNAALVWGGIIWSRTYESEGKTLTFTAQTFESYLYKQVIETTQNFVNVDQRNVLVSLINSMQAKAYANIGIQVPSSFSNSIVRSTTFWNYEVWSYGKAVENLVGYADGFDYTIDVQYAAGVPVKQLLVDNTLGSSASTSGLAWDYPGGIKNYYWPENASDAATTIIGVAAGEGSAMLRGKAQNVSPLLGGYPDLQEVYTNKDIGRATTLSSHLSSELKRISVPITSPTFEVNPEIGPGINDFALGDYGYVSIDDPRFPLTIRYLARVVGYQAKAPQSDGPEEFKLILEGQDDG